MFDLEENLRELPHSPGVYLHKDKNENIIYVGKAVSLKNRVRQYFRSSKNMDAKTYKLSQNIYSFEYIVTDTEMEALLLECTLIKKYMPKYNILLRDDKTYPYIKITYQDDFPRIIKTRTFEKETGKYFGPYTDVGAVNRIVDLINNIFHLKKCTYKTFPENFKPCLNYHINQCDGICNGSADKAEYMKKIKIIEEFLKGKNKYIAEYLKNEMLQASEKMEYEKAAKFRDYLNDVEIISEKQKVTSLNLNDLDIVISMEYKEEISVVLFFVRDGKLSGREIFRMKGAQSKEECISEFIKQHYTRVVEIPKEIIVERDFVEKEETEKFLSCIAAKKINIKTPVKGEKKELLNLAINNVDELIRNLVSKDTKKILYRKKLINDINMVIKKVEGESYNENKCVKEENFNKFRVESYDISNTSGIDSVGGMVVFNGDKASKKEYRKFKIKTIEGPDDYGSLQEMIIRRLKRALNGDESFLPLPDLIVMDGGKGQVTAGKKAVNAMGINIPVIGLAKNDAHRTDRIVFVDKKSSSMEEISLDKKNHLLHYFGKMQEEVHNYAITYHRKKRDKNMKKSELDNIKGIGEKTKIELMKKFKSFDNIKKASIDELSSVDGIGEKTAKIIVDHFLANKS